MKIGLSAVEGHVLLYNLNVPLVSHTTYISHRTPVVGKKRKKNTLATAERPMGLIHTHTY